MQPLLRPWPILMTLLLLWAPHLEAQKPATSLDIVAKKFERYQDESLRIRLTSPQNAWVDVRVFSSEDTPVLVAKGSGFLLAKSEGVISLEEEHGGVKDEQKYSIKIAPRYLQDPSSEILQPLDSGTKQTHYSILSPLQQVEIAQGVSDPWSPSVVLSRDGKVELVFDTVFPPGHEKRYEGKSTGKKLEQKFEVNLKDVDDGCYRYHFEGKSADGEKLADEGTVFLLKVDARPTLTGNIQISIDELSNLSIKFQLSRLVQPSVKMPDDTLLPTTQVEKDKLPYTFEAKMSLDAESYLKKLRGVVENVSAGDAKRPLDLTVVYRPYNKDVEIGKFRVDVLRVDATKLVSKLSEVQKKPQDQTAAKDVAKEALGINGNPQKGSVEERAVDYIASVLMEKKPPRDKFVAFATVAAKVGASFFGIPVLAH
jgi:hypothetical protein